MGRIRKTLKCLGKRVKKAIKKPRRPRLMDAFCQYGFNYFLKKRERRNTKKDGNP
jgi:hypothetical protein